MRVRELVTALAVVVGGCSTFSTAPADSDAGPSVPADAGPCPTPGLSKDGLRFCDDFDGTALTPGVWTQTSGEVQVAGGILTASADTNKESHVGVVLMSKVVTCTIHVKVPNDRPFTEILVARLLKRGVSNTAVRALSVVTSGPTVSIDARWLPPDGGGIATHPGKEAQLSNTFSKIVLELSSAQVSGSYDGVELVSSNEDLGGAEGDRVELTVGVGNSPTDRRTATYDDVDCTLSP